MSFLFKKYISTILLIILSWSCAGLGFSMMGHGMSIFNSNFFDQNPLGLHECCDIGSEGLAMSNVKKMGHHKSIIAIFSSVNIFFISAIFFVSFLILYSQIKGTFRQALLYLRYKFQRCSYFSIYIRRLFSQGILHSKTW